MYGARLNTGDMVVNRIDMLLTSGADNVVREYTPDKFNYSYMLQRSKTATYEHKHFRDLTSTTGTGKTSLKKRHLA